MCLQAMCVQLAICKCCRLTPRAQLFSPTIRTISRTARANQAHVVRGHKSYCKLH